MNIFKLLLGVMRLPFLSLFYQKCSMSVPSDRQTHSQMETAKSTRALLLLQTFAPNNHSVRGISRYGLVPNDAVTVNCVLPQKQ